MPPAWSSADEAFMRRALELARQSEGFTNPNPLVGAVVVNDEQLVGQGFTASYGGPHAERNALDQAGGSAKGATLYVSWEPCVAYPGKHTPPCAELILATGVRRVVVAAQDPHPQINGRGLDALRRAGLQVEVGLLREEALQLNEISVAYHTKGRPFVCLKWAMTLDGKIATRSGDSKWISNASSREWAHKLRRRHAAIVVGVNTVIKDDPALTVRRVPGRDPWRIVLDSQGRIPLTAQLLRLQSQVPTVIATTSAMPQETEDALTRLKARVWRLPAVDGRVDLGALLTHMKEHELDSLLVEGGGEVLWSFASTRLFDKIVCFVAPKLVGGQTSASPFGGAGISELKDALQLEKLTATSLQGDLLITAYPAE